MSRLSGTAGAEEKTPAKGFVTIVIVLLLIAAVALIGYYKVVKPAGGLGSILTISTTSTSSTSTSSTTSSTTSTTSSTSTSSTTSSSSTTTSSTTSTSSTSTSIPEWKMCAGKEIPDSMLSVENGTIPEDAVKAVLCIKGFGQQNAYTSMMDSLKSKEGVITASITYRYPIGYVIYYPKEITIADIISTLGDYSITVVKDGIR